MDKLLLHPVTRRQLAQFTAAPSHALLLLGPDGSGKYSVAERLASDLLHATDMKLVDHPSVVYITSADKSISIEAIRQLQSRLQLKTVGQNSVRRIVLIEGAHRMTIEAQNALLKLLEEPPEDTVFILTATSARSVLPTIYSRTQHIELKTPSTDKIRAYFTQQGHSDEAITNALRYSGQRVGLAQAILEQTETHPLLSAVNSVRQVLAAPLFERLQMIDEWVKQKDELVDRLDSLARLCHAGLEQAIEREDAGQASRWQRYTQAVYDTRAGLNHNPNTKLLMTNLFLRLS